MQSETLWSLVHPPCGGTNQVIRLSTGGSLFSFTLLFMLATLISACQPAANTTTSPTTPVPRIEARPVPGGPLLLRDDISLRKVAEIGGGAIKLAWNPADGGLYVLHPVDGIYHLDLSQPSAPRQVATIREITTDGFPAGMASGPDGRLYVVVNRKPSRTTTQAVILTGEPAGSASLSWRVLAKTEPYPTSNTPFDHLFNGIVVDGDGRWVYLNSGSRTDHGEVESNNGSFPDLRETALTGKILRIPADSADLTLPNDEAALSAQGLLFARGTRNAYDLAFAPNGDLFAVDNGPDADYPDELNWIREGQHYGFPWRFGDQDNPQQFADYDASQDARLSPDFVAVQNGTYRNDPDFPPAPGPFTDPVSNLGPDAAQYRDDEGAEHNAAAEGLPLQTFTPHRSPLGLVFVTDHSLPADLQGDDQTMSAFVLSWGAAGGVLSDKGQDLLHLALTKKGDHYESVTRQIARDLQHPIDAVMIEGRLFVLEYGAEGALWEFSFEE